MRNPLSLFVGVTLFGLASVGPAFAQEKATGSFNCAVVKAVDPNTKIVSEKTVCTQGSNALRGLHWGTGLAYGTAHSSIGEVKIVSNGGVNTVRVTKESSAAVRALFELHYFFPLAKGWDSEFAWGPFVSLNTKPLDNLGGTTFTSAGIGLMVGAKVGSTYEHSINFGIGWMIDTDVKKLANGVADGSVTSLAPGNEASLLNSRTQNGLMLMLSYNFEFK